MAPTPPEGVSFTPRKTPQGHCGVFGKNGGPGAIRTPDPLVRSQVLYPTELRARTASRRGAYCSDHAR